MDKTSKSVSQDEPLLFISQLSQVFYYSNGKLTNIYKNYGRGV